MLDTLTVTKRNLIAYTRIPEAVFFSSVQPIMFVLLFRYVFGGAIRTPGFSYVDFMMPGIFVQTVAFGAMNTERSDRAVQGPADGALGRSRR